MAAWDDIINEIRFTNIKSSYDVVRNKYLKKLSEYTGRNVIAYYSAWLTKSNINSDINDMDMTGFMNAIKGMDCSKGLDLVLHTPGGFPVAAEAIIKYLRSKFGKDIRVIVPQLAMSAGTMMACSGKAIVMGKHSSLGPIDPQFNGIPAYNIMKEYEQAKEDLVKHPEHVNYWALIIQKYPAAFLKTAIDAIALSGKLLEEWLGSCMFDNQNPKHVPIIKNIVNKLNDHSDSINHGRHFDISFCRDIGLKIIELESDQKLQNAVLSVHHSFMHTLTTTQVVKIIENQSGRAWINAEA